MQGCAVHQYPDAVLGIIYFINAVIIPFFDDEMFILPDRFQYRVAKIMAVKTAKNNFLLSANPENENQTATHNKAKDQR